MCCLTFELDLDLTSNKLATVSMQCCTLICLLGWLKWINRFLSELATFEATVFLYI